MKSSSFIWRAMPAVGLLLTLFLGTMAWQKASGTDERQELRAIVDRLNLQPLALPPPQDPDLVALGEALFFEVELSGNRDLSCATCHHPSLGLGDGLSLSIGPGGKGLGPMREADPARPRAPRNAISLVNSGVAGRSSYFWDGRVEALSAGDYRTPASSYLPAGLDSALAAQAMFPVIMRHEMRGGWYDVAGYAIEPGTSPDDERYDALRGGWRDVDVLGNPNELAAIANGVDQMPQIWKALMARLLALPNYRRLFDRAYPYLDQRQLGFEHAANALAAYQADVFSDVDTSWDRFLAGDVDALSERAVAGALLFYGKAGCSSCHGGSLLSDQEYHNIGAPQFGPGTDDDAPLDYGRWRVTGEERDRFAFRTPPLRNVAHTGPWLHNGAYSSLADVLRHHLDAQAALRSYTGSHLPPDIQATLQNEPVTLQAILQTLDPLLQEPRRLNAREIEQLLAFLHALGPAER